MNYYQEPDNIIRGKVKVVLDLSNYATRKELKDATGVDASNLAAKRDFIALKAKFDKLGTNKFAYVLKDLNNLKRKINDLDVDKLRTIPVDWNK